ncbi:MAG: prepilin-type N-terminal cleavage/methylation domain-containing protein [Candidatus Riflebacteria bacterium]
MKVFNKIIKNRSAFTMMEVMAGLAIISIVTSIGLPAIDNFYSSTRVKAEAEIFVSNLRTARYSAMSTQAMHRLILHPEGGYYKIQAFAPDFEEDYAGATASSTAGVTIDGDAMTEYDSPDWLSIIDGEEHEVDAGVSIYRSASMPQIVFFQPNGYLSYDSDGSNVFDVSDQAPLPETHVTFVYGSSAIRVIINAFGVMSSEAYQVDEDFNPDNDGVIW